MSNTRNLADLLDTSGDIKSAALDNVTPTTSASDLTSGTLAAARLANNTIDSAHITAGAVDDAHISGLAATKLTGTIAADRLSTAATQSASNNSTKIATTAYTDAQVATVVDSAPGTLNTLNELAAALGDDANFSTTVTNSIAAKLPLAGGTMTGGLSGTTAAFSSTITSNGQAQLNNNNLIGLNTGATSEWIAKRTSSGEGIHITTTNASGADTQRLAITSNADTANFLIKSSNVGIGTTSPSKTLSVHSTSGSAGTPNGLYLYNEVHGSDSQIYIYAENDSGANQGANIKLDPDAETFSLIGTGGQTAITIADSGKVGIGTSSPSAVLETKNTTDGSTFAFQATNDNDHEIVQIGAQSDGDGYLTVHGQGASTNIKALIHSDGNSYFNGGNVGINTSSPSSGYMLHVGGSSGVHTKVKIEATTATGQAELDLSADPAGVSYLNLGDEDSYNIGRIGYFHSDNSMRLQTNSAERLRIDSSGNVGIGTTSISFPSGSGLEVYDANHPRIKLANTDTGNASTDGFDIHLDGSTKDVKFYHRESANMIFATNNAERMRITHIGNVVHQGNGGVEVFYAHGTVAGSTALSVDVPCDDDSSTGTVFHIEASMTHHPSYDAILESWLSCRGTGYTNYEQFRRDTGSSGAWSVSRTSNENLRVSKSAGSYAGPGPWWVRVTYRRT